MLAERQRLGERGRRARVHELLELRGARPPGVLAVAAKAGISQPLAVIRVARARFRVQVFHEDGADDADGRCASRGEANEGFSMVALGEVSSGGQGSLWWSGTTRVGGHELVTLLSHFCRAGPFPRRFDRWKRGLSRTLLRSRCANRFFVALGVLVARRRNNVDTAAR